MIGPRPHAPARWVLAVVVAFLPAPSRDRYREEFRAELAELGWAPQVFQASTLLIGSVSLRKALSGVDVIEELTIRKDWRCRLGRHHYFRIKDDNPEMPERWFLRCAGCQKARELPRSRAAAARRALESFVASGGGNW